MLIDNKELMREKIEEKFSLQKIVFLISEFMKNL